MLLAASPSEQPNYSFKLTPLRCVVRVHTLRSHTSAATARRSLTQALGCLETSTRFKTAIAVRKADSVLPGIYPPAVCRLFNAISGRSKACAVAAERSDVWVPVLSLFLETHALAAQTLALGYNGNSAGPQPNNSFKLTSLRGAAFSGSVYHNAAPLRSAT